jgi:hypothetical protein
MSIYQKLKKAAYKSGVKEIEENIDCFEYNFFRIEEQGFIIGITINRNSSWKIPITLAHEVGHAIYFKDKTAEEREEACERRYRNFYKQSLTEEDKTNIYTEEEYAWAIGKELLKKLGYKDWKSFDKLRKESLSSYKKPHK